MSENLTLDNASTKFSSEEKIKIEHISQKVEKVHSMHHFFID